VGTSLRDLRPVSWLFLARHCRHRHVDLESSYCYEAVPSPGFHQDDKNAVGPGNYPNTGPRVDVMLSFGETLPLLDNFLRITPYETSTRPLRTISDMLTYRKAHSTLSGAALVSLKTRIRAGEPKFIQQLWNCREKTFLAIDFEWSERNTSSCLEWGYAAVRCSNLDVSVVRSHPLRTFTDIPLGQPWDLAPGSE